MDNFSIHDWRQNLFLNEAKFDPKKSDLNKDGKLSDYEKKRGTTIANNMDEVQMGAEFSFTDFKWDADPNNPNKRVPKAIAFDFPKVKEIVGSQNIRLASKTVGTNARGRGAGRDKKEFVIYISKDLKTALDQITRGRTSRQTEKNKFDLTKKIDALPSMVRNILKKGSDGSKLLDFGGVQMYPVNWPVLGQSMENPNIYWLATKLPMEEAVPFKKNALGEQPTKMHHDALDLEENDWQTDPSDESSMIQVQLKSIIENATKILQMNQGSAQYDAWVQAKITKAADYLQSVSDYQSYES